MSKDDGSKPLKNSRHEEFANLLVKKKLSASEAYRQAGYSAKAAHKNASHLTANAGIQKRIEFLKSKIAEKAIIDGAELVRRTIEIADDCSKKVEVLKYEDFKSSPMKDVDGNQIVRANDPNSAIKALSLAADILGVKKTGVVIEERDPVKEILETLVDDETD